MTISSLLGYMPSLADFMSTGSGNAPSSTGIDLMKINSGGQQDLASLLSESDTVNLSPAAQQILSQNGAQTDTASSTKDLEGAQNFVANFFASNGIDTDNLSDEAVSLLQGLESMVADMTGATRDSAIDGMTSSYARGSRESYTLAADGKRLSFTIQYEAGKPKTLTVTDVNGASADSAVVNFTSDATGAISGVSVQSTQKQYNSFGGLTSSVPGESLAFDLYTS